MENYRKEIFERLKYTILTSTYEDVDEMLRTLIMKENVAELYQELFQGCEPDQKGELVPGGFFEAPFPSATLEYAMYNLLGWAPQSFLLKHKIRRIAIKGRLGVSSGFRIPPGIFQLPMVEEIHISNMGISELPVLSSNCPSLKYLNLSRNNLRFLPGQFLRFSRLKTLDLSYNQLSGFPAAGKGLQSLENLHLQANRFSRFPRELLVLKKIRRLDISMNYLEEIESGITELGDLQNLHLAFNQLTPKEEIQWEDFFPKEKQHSLGL